MALLITVTGRSPAALGEEDEVRGSDVLGTFDHTMDVVTMRLVLLLDDKHRQFVAVTFEACAKALGIQLIGKVAEVLLGQRVRDPLPIDHLALGKRNVDRIWDPVVEVVRLEICGGEHGLRYVVNGTYLFIRTLPDLWGV